MHGSLEHRDRLSYAMETAAEARVTVGIPCCSHLWEIALDGSSRGADYRNSVAEPQIRPFCDVPDVRFRRAQAADKQPHRETWLNVLYCARSATATGNLAALIA